MTERFNFYVPFSSNAVYPDMVKGFMHKELDGSTRFIEDPVGNTFFKDPVTNTVTKEWYLEGIASTQDVDRDDECMSESALMKMKSDIMTHSVNIFGNHEHHWENTLGGIKEAQLIDSSKKLWIKFLCDDPETNPKIPALINKLKRRIGLGFSIGGRVLKAHKEFRGIKEVNVIDDLELLEISVVGIPANKYCDMSISQQIMKSAKKEKSCQICWNTGTSNRCPVCMCSL